MKITRPNKTTGAVSMNLRIARVILPSKLVQLLMIALLSVTVAAPLLAQSQSASYLLQQSTVNDGGTRSTSASYALAGSMGQESAIGTSSAPHYVVQSGFWSFVGS